jgi:hypothetical protein
MRKFLLTAATVIALGASGQAMATPVFVGSWEVDQGPYWGSEPLAYTGQEAAALLFGGTASEYVISTVDNIPADINNEAWYSILGYGSGQFAQNYVASGSDQCCGLYYSGGGYNGNANEAASAYVWDNAQGSSFTNYAFLAPVPEPGSLALLGAALAGFGVIRRRRKAA